MLHATLGGNMIVVVAVAVVLCSCTVPVGRSSSVVLASAVGPWSDKGQAAHGACWLMLHARGSV